MAARFSLKSIDHPKTPSARSRRFASDFGAYGACVAAKPAKVIVNVPAMIIGAF
jgi:hypothetical protein